MTPFSSVPQTAIGFHTAKLLLLQCSTQGSCLKKKKKESKSQGKNILLTHGKKTHVAGEKSDSFINVTQSKSQYVLAVKQTHIHTHALSHLHITHTHTQLQSSIPFSPWIYFLVRIGFILWPQPLRKGQAAEQNGNNAPEMVPSVEHD